MAILLSLGYLWINQFIELMIALYLHYTSDLDLYFLPLALICAVWQGNGIHSASPNSRVPAHPSFALANLISEEFAWSCYKEKNKYKGKGTPCPTLQTIL